VVGNIQPITRKLHPGVEFAGIADDLHAEYAAACLALVPLRAGSGLKIKLAEALAHGLPVVSTTAGASGIASSPTRFLRIHDDPQPFAEATSEILVAADWADLSAGAMAFAQTQFSEAAAVNALRQAFWP
jgi:glycosyltransferase involved in cell wall biosynthesis